VTPVKVLILDDELVHCEFIVQKQASEENIHTNTTLIRQMELDELSGEVAKATLNSVDEWSSSSLSEIGGTEPSTISSGCALIHGHLAHSIYEEHLLQKVPEFNAA
jgi:hypothetical protein